MEQTIGTICFFIAAFSLISILIGFIKLFNKDTRKQGLILLIISIIVFIIGFSKCTKLFRWH